jgi:hypothetical protein
VIVRFLLPQVLKVTLNEQGLAGSGIASIETIGGDFLRRRMSTRLTASLCSHVEKADSPRKV